MMTALLLRLGVLLAGPVLASCHFSFSTGGPDYAKLERAITDKLNESYKPISQTVSTVDCPKNSTAKAGDTIVCTADVDGNKVRVQAKFTDDNGNVDFSTLDTVYDLQTTAKGLSEDISRDRGFTVTVKCGEGLKVVEIGQSFECQAFDPRGVSRTVRITAGGVGQGDQWKILE